MDVSLQKISIGARPILENLFRYYVYDLSECAGQSPDGDGRYSFNAEALNLYWMDAGHVPYFIIAGGEIVGFALIRKYPNAPEVLDIEQFFVLRKFKRQGIGKKALAQILLSHPGKWQIRVLKENIKGLKFWLTAVNSLVGNTYQQTLDIDVGLEMHFIRFTTRC